MLYSCYVLKYISRGLNPGLFAEPSGRDLQGCTFLSYFKTGNKEF